MIMNPMLRRLQQLLQHQQLCQRKAAAVVDLEVAFSIITEITSHSWTTQLEKACSIPRLMRDWVANLGTHTFLVTFALAKAFATTTQLSPAF